MMTGFKCADTLSTVDVDMRNYTTDPYTSNTLNSFTKSSVRNVLICSHSLM